MSLREEMRAAYDRSGAAWDGGPARVYRALAEPVVDAAGDVAGTRVVDVGTGSGALADALVRRGARVLGLDLAHGMLAHRAAERPPSVVGDVLALPVRTGCVDVVTAAFVLNHLADPSRAMREAGRVLRPGGRLLATTFEGDAAHPAKAAVDQVVLRFGFEPPAWYREVKERAMPTLADVASFAGYATRSGLVDVTVARVAVAVPLSPSEVAGWRLGMAQVVPFVAALPAHRRASLVTEARQAAAAAVDEPLRLPLLLLRASAPARS